MGWSTQEYGEGFIAECYWYDKPRILGKVLYARKWTGYQRYQRRAMFSKVTFYINPIFILNKTPSMEYDYKFRGRASPWQEKYIKMICTPKNKPCDVCKYRFMCYTTRA